MENEIIAYKATEAGNDFTKQLIRNSIAAVIIALCGVLSIIQKHEWTIISILFVVSAAELLLSFMYFVMLQQYKKAPSVLITLGNNGFIIHDGREIPFKSIIDVKYKINFSGRRNFMYKNNTSYGSLIIELFNGKKINIRFAEDIKNVSSRMSDIKFHAERMGESANKPSNPTNDTLF